MELLPDEDQRESLLDQLGRLVLAAGPDAFVAAPIVLPDDASFPDRWTPDVDGVHRLLRRVMTYAGLGDLGIDVSVDHYAETTKVEIDANGQLRATAYAGAAAWFAGIDRTGACRFGVDLHGLDDPQGLTGTLAHEVAHAYRHHEDLVQKPSELEERLTDLTTVYLGFGVLTLNATQRHRSGARGWSTAHAGYLSPQAMAFLLAAQVVVRGEDPKRIARHLAANQAACFRAACEELRGDGRDALIARLGLPMPSLWPRPRALPAVEDEDDDDDEADELDPEDELADEHPTFRVERRYPRKLVMGLGLTIGASLAAVFAIAGNPIVAIACGAGGPLATALVVPRRNHDECADPSCRTNLGPKALVCPGCHRRVVGRVEVPDDRLEAAERWERANKPKKKKGDPYRES